MLLCIVDTQIDLSRICPVYYVVNMRWINFERKRIEEVVIHQFDAGSF